MSTKSASAIHSKVKAQFSKTASNYISSPIHAKGADLKRLLDLAGDVRAKRVLDVATGGGHTALSFARAGAVVTATDLTPEMLEAAEAHIRSQGIEDVSYTLAPAEDLPFEAGRFDIVTCRIAPHHFADPAAFVREVARVLVAGGQFLLIDNISPENRRLAEAVNHIEKTRDPSHVEAYSLTTWLSWLRSAGLEAHYFERFRRTKDYADWISNAQAHALEVQLAAWILALPEAVKAYLEVQTEQGRLVSLSHEVMLLSAQTLPHPLKD